MEESDNDGSQEIGNIIEELFFPSSLHAEFYGTTSIFCYLHSGSNIFLCFFSSKEKYLFWVWDVGIEN